MLIDGSEGGFVLFVFFNFSKEGSFCIIIPLFRGFRVQMSSAAYFKDCGMQVAPVLKALKLACARHREFLCKLHFIGFLIELVETLRDDCSCVEDTRKLSSQ